MCPVVSIFVFAALVLYRSVSFFGSDCTPDCTRLAVLRRAGQGLGSVFLLKLFGYTALYGFSDFRPMETTKMM